MYNLILKVHNVQPYSKGTYIYIYIWGWKIAISFTNFVQIWWNNLASNVLDEKPQPILQFFLYIIQHFVAWIALCLLTGNGGHYCIWFGLKLVLQQWANQLSSSATSSLAQHFGLELFDSTLRPQALRLDISTSSFLASNSLAFSSLAVAELEHIFWEGQNKFDA